MSAARPKRDGPTGFAVVGGPRDNGHRGRKVTSTRSDVETMAHRKNKSIAPSPVWQVPAATWDEVVRRYVAFIQVPTWRASVKRDGSEKRTCLSEREAAELRTQMLAALDLVFPTQTHPSAGRNPKLADLLRFVERQGRRVPRDQRCPTRVSTHLQRAFLFNAAGYTCLYCGRSAWGVLGERTGPEPRRTLRFEIDHRTTRRRLAGPERFNPKNLVVACRSCNAVKAEMLETRFRLELESLARAVVRDPCADPATPFQQMSERR
jgi:5-methylcytosine-specific restriction endonuclease McrA